MKNKILIWLVAFSFLFSTNRANAIIPYIVPIATYFGATAELAAALDWSIALHAAVLAYSFDKDSGKATSNTSSDITVYLDPNTPLITPDGWVPPAAGSIYPTPPTSSPSSSTYQLLMTSLGSFSTAQGACDAYRDYVKPSYTSSTITNAVYWPYCNLYKNGVYLQQMAMTSSLTCSSGYTLSGSTCNLTNPPVVKKPADNNCQITRTGNSYGVDPQDPDCAAGQPAVLNTTITPDTITMTRPDGSSATGHINPDGSTTVTESYPDSPTATTHTYQTDFSPPSSGGGPTQFLGRKYTETSGTGTLATPAGANGNGHGPTGDGQIVVDKLNAQDAAAQAAAAGNQPLPDNPSKVSDLNLPTSNPFSSPVPDFIKDIVPSSGSGGCVPLSVDLPFFGSLSFAPCEIIDAVRPIIDYLLISLGVLGGVLVWIRPESGGGE